MKKISIRWVDVTTEIVTIEKYNEILKKVIEKYKCKQHKVQDIIPLIDAAGTYQIYQSESYLELRYYYNGLHKIRVSFTGIKQSTVHAGKDGYSYINDMFEEKYKTSLFQAYSGKKYKQEYLDIKKCIPTQIDFYNKFAANEISENCFKSDVSSAFPYQLTKSIPTLHDCKRLSGRAEPNEEYPFAFYTKSHHVKIYKELYTRNFKKSLYYPAYYDYLTKWTPNDDIKPEEDETILCKESEYSLKDIFEKIYSERKEKPELKTYMVAAIGYFQKNSNPTLSQISAVVLSRCINDMLNRCEILTKENNRILLINTDSIVWQGKQSKISQTEKKLGNFVIEYENCKLALAGVKTYQIEGQNGSVLTRHSGMKKIDSRKLKFGEIFQTNLEKQVDLFQYYTDEKGYIKELLNGKR